MRDSKQVAFLVFFQYIHQLVVRAGAADEKVSFKEVVPQSMLPAFNTDEKEALDKMMAIAARLVSARDDTEAAVENHHPSSLLATLFEQISLTDEAHPNKGGQEYAYPLETLSPQNIFPRLRTAFNPSSQESIQTAYRKLWRQFKEGLEKIPASHRGNFDLWLDHFDTLWLNIAHAIPADHNGEISLYDDSKTAAALATALWSWHREKEQTDTQAIAKLQSEQDWDEEKFILIQGDFFGIQNFIFSSGSDTQKKAAKILRGRSFQVSLFAELAALKILQACALPPTSQVLNAAGKFMIVAPNTERIREAVDKTRQEINQWFLDHTYGQLALGLATQKACCHDFAEKRRFAALVRKSFAVLEKAKLQRFNLTGDAPKVFAVAYPAGSCPYDHHLPAKGTKDQREPAPLSADQISLGNLLTRLDRMMVLKDRREIHDDSHTKVLQLPIFGYHIAFTAHEDVSGKFGKAAEEGSLLRCWDFSLPRMQDESLWHGYARRYINAHVPRFSGYEEIDKYTEDKDDIKQGDIKTFAHLACEERKNENGRYLGNIAIATLKGDVDNLGKIFEKGLAEPTFAKMAALSRQMNHFFSLWLPAYCQEQYPDTYTVFAGGDDFFMIGPWYKTQQLAAKMREAFTHYVAANPGITFSAGISITKPGLPLPKLSSYAEEALDMAKSHSANGQHKNAVSIYGEVLPWPHWEKVNQAFENIDKIKQDYGMSSGYLYDQLHYCDLAQREKGGDIQASMWRSRLYYRSRRYVTQNINKDKRDAAYQALLQIFEVQGIATLGSTFRIPLFNHFYHLRAR